MQRNLRTIVFSLLLIAAGVLALLSNLKILPIDLNHNYPLLVAGFGLGGLAFLAVFVTDVRDSWWASIPSLTLLGLALLFLTVNALGGISAALFIGMIALSFWLIYLTHHDFWWAIIPGGVLLSVAALIAIAVGSKDGFAAVSVLFLGMAATFLVVYVATRQRWTFWPAGVLAILGTLFLIGAAGIAQYLWPLILVVAGAYLVFRSLPKKQ